MANISENKGYGFLGKAVEENETIEFKSSFNIATIETLTAFANTKGGSVYIGISDNKKIVGVALSPESIQQWVNEIKSKTDPSVLVDATTMQIDGKTIVRLATQEHAIKPVACQGRFYKRIRNSNHLMSALEISNLSLQSMQVSWDSFPAYGQTIEDLDIEKIDKFINRVNTKGRLSLIGKDRMDNLSKLRLLRDGQPTHAAYLLFGKENIGYNVHLGRFKTPSLIIDDRMLNCNLFDAVEETMKYLIGQIKVAYEITGRTTQRTEIFEYPLPALREIVLNTLIHRDYTSSVDVQIKIFDQKITFFSPGGLFDKQTIEALKTDNYQAYTRNKLIAEAFYLAGDIEKYGTGYTRIRNEIKDYPTMSFEFEEMANAWLVTLSYEKQHISSKDNENDAENIFEKLSERQRLIIGHLQKNAEVGTVNGTEDDTVNGTVNGTVNAQKLSDLLGVSLRTIKRELYVLQDLGLIRHTGSDKTGSWELCAFIPDYQAEDESLGDLIKDITVGISKGSREEWSEEQWDAWADSLEMRAKEIERQAKKMEKSIETTTKSHVNVNINRPSPYEYRGLLYDANWAGFEAGLNMLTPGNLPEWMGLRQMRSWCFNINIADVGIAFNRQHSMGIFTGIGIGWNNYSFNKPMFFEKDAEGYLNETPILDEQGLPLNIKRSKIGVFYAQMPLMIEFKPFRQRMYIDLGVTCGMRITSWQTIEFGHNYGKYAILGEGENAELIAADKTRDLQHKDLCVNFFKVDATLRAGSVSDDIGFFVKYSLLPLFTEGKVKDADGTIVKDVLPLNIGFSINF